MQVDLPCNWKQKPQSTNSRPSATSNLQPTEYLDLHTQQYAFVLMVL